MVVKWVEAARWTVAKWEVARCTAAVARCTAAVAKERVLLDLTRAKVARAKAAKVARAKVARAKVTDGTRILSMTSLHEFSW